LLDICGSAAHLSDFLLRLPDSINAVAMPCAALRRNVGAPRWARQENQ
jgi:hypothetical protein